MKKIPFDILFNIWRWKIAFLFKIEKEKGTLNFQNISVHIYYYSVYHSGEKKYLSILLKTLRIGRGCTVNNWVDRGPWEGPPGKKGKINLIWRGIKGVLSFRWKEQTGCRCGVTIGVSALSVRAERFRGGAALSLSSPLEIPSWESSNSNGRARREWIIRVNSTNYRLIVIVHAQRKYSRVDRVAGLVKRGLRRWAGQLGPWFSSDKFQLFGYLTRITANWWERLLAYNLMAHF